MTISKRVALSCWSEPLAILDWNLGNGYRYPVFTALSHPAQAIVGRPLTPVSVAGVARRTARRCAAGVYYC